MGEGREEGRAPCVCLDRSPKTPGYDELLVTSSRWPEVELPFSSNTIRPGTAPRLRGTRQTRHHSRGSLQAPESFQIVKPLVHKPSEADVIHQPQSQKIRPDTGTAKTHEGERNAR